MPLFERERNSRYVDEDAVYVEYRPSGAERRAKRLEKLHRQWWIDHYRKGRTWAEIARDYRRTPDAIRKGADRWYEDYAAEDWVPKLHPLMGCRAWPVQFEQAAELLEPRELLYRCPVCSGLVIDREEQLETWLPGVKPQHPFVCCVCDSANARNNARLAQQRHAAEQAEQRHTGNYYRTDPNPSEAIAC